MNIHEYISSGILEAYLLGELSETEALAVLDMMARHPEVRMEFDRLEETMESVAEHSSVTPPQHLKASVLSKIDEHRELSASSSFHDEPSTSFLDDGRGPKWLKSGLIAALLGIVLSAIIIFNCLKKSEVQKDNLNLLTETNNQLSADNAQLAQQLIITQQNLKIISDPAFQEVKMAGLPISPNSFAQVYWNSDNNEVYLQAGSLAAPSANKQYQLWAIVDGSPVSAGVFDLEETPALIKMQSISDASAFAITLENQGGVVSPTLDQMYVIGEVAPS